MKFSGFIVLASALLLPAGRAADATTPVDATQRNAPFAPAASVQPAKNAPSRADSVQEKRVEKTTVEKSRAAVGGKRAAIDVGETQPKDVREKNSRRPETLEQPKSGFNHREAAIAPATDTKKPPLVAKFQDSLTAASATNMARFPALDRATSAKINRFVFRKNGAEPANSPDPTSATPVAGGSPVKK